MLGRVYEYFLARFASAEGKLGGEFYTPRSVVRLLVEMIEPLKGRVYDPCCGSGGMFVQSEKFVEAHGGDAGRHRDLRAGVQPDDLAAGEDEPRDPGHRGRPRARARRHVPPRDLHRDLKADYILANPPFNMSDWGGERAEGRRAVAVRDATGAAMPTTRGSSTSSTTSRRTGWPGS